MRNTQKTKRFFGFKFYPKVEQGSTVVVKSKPKKEKKENNGTNEKIDWEEWGAKILATTTSILTLILLINATKK